MHTVTFNLLWPYGRCPIALYPFGGLLLSISPDFANDFDSFGSLIVFEYLQGIDRSGPGKESPPIPMTRLWPSPARVVEATAS